MSRPAMAVLFAATLFGSGCVVTDTRDCGLYDFDCENSVEGPDQVNVFSGGETVDKADTASPASANSAAAPSRADLEHRIEAMEAELAELRRLLQQQPVR